MPLLLTREDTEANRVFFNSFVYKMISLGTQNCNKNFYVKVASKSVTVSMLFLRIIAVLAATATIALLVTNNVTYEGGFKLKFKDFISYRYVLAVAVITVAYCILQLPFSIYYRLVRNGYLPDFDFFGDKVISLLLATGIGAGLAVSFEFKRLLDNLFYDEEVSKDDPTRKTNDKFLIRGIIASAVLAVPFLSMVVVSVISSVNRHRTKADIFQSPTNRLN